MSRSFVAACVVSFLLVAFGWPGYAPMFGVCASACGYALFWSRLFSFSSKRLRFGAATTWFFCVQLVWLSWFTSHEYHGYYTFFVYGGLSLWIGVQFGLLSLLLPANRKEVTVFRALVVAAVWTLFEWSRLYVLCGFAWSVSGLSLCVTEWSSQLAAIFGALGLSFYVIFTNVIALRQKKMFFSALVVAPYLFGAAWIGALEGREGQLYRVAVVQTGMRPEEKRPLIREEKAFVSPLLQWRSIVKMLDVCDMREVDLIVLPEAVVPFGEGANLYPGEVVKTLLGESTHSKSVSNGDIARALATKYGCEIIVGLDYSDAVAVKNYNSAFHFFPNKGEGERYDKKVLVPLAEYLPLQVLRPLVEKYGITGFFTHGKKEALFKGKVAITPSICYEECFGHIVREGKRLGGELFVNITNDVWYPASTLPWNHFCHGRMRAIENGTPLVRACNTGVSGGVDRFGRLVGSIKGEWTRDVLVVDIDLVSHKTPYTFWGNWAIVGASMLLLMMGIWKFILEQNIGGR